MAQQLKPEIREQIEAAALTCFARQGLAAARMEDIAREAGVSTGNVYRYFAGKEDLFYRVITGGFVQQVRRMLLDRFRAALEAPGGSYADMLRLDDRQLAFVAQHRLQVVVLLTRSEGTRYAAVAEELADMMRRQARAWARRHGVAVSGERHRVVSLVYRHYLREMAEILRVTDTPEAMREALELLMGYHLAGMGHLLTRPGALE